jgi:hypothetical protein
MKKHVFERYLSLSYLLILTLILSLSPKSISAEEVAASSALHYLPLVMKQPSTPSPGIRLVLFEGFYNPT